MAANTIVPDVSIKIGTTAVTDFAAIVVGSDIKIVVGYAALDFGSKVDVVVTITENDSTGV